MTTSTMTIGEALEVLGINVLNDQGGNGLWTGDDEISDTREEVISNCEK